MQIIFVIPKSEHV